MAEAIIIQIIADWLVVPIIATAVVVLCRVPKKDREQCYIRVGLMALLAFFFAKCASLFYQNGSRPFVQLGVQPGASHANNPGFPSEHALLVFAIVCVVWALTKDWKLTALLLCAACAVGMGRVLAFVHTPADIIAGAGCALCATLCMYGRSFFKQR